MSRNFPGYALVEHEGRWYVAKDGEPVSEVTIPASHSFAASLSDPERELISAFQRGIAYIIEQYFVLNHQKISEQITRIAKERSALSVGFRVPEENISRMMNGPLMTIGRSYIEGLRREQREAGSEDRLADLPIGPAVFNAEQRIASNPSRNEQAVKDYLKTNLLLFDLPREQLKEVKNHYMMRAGEMCEYYLWSVDHPNLSQMLRGYQVSGAFSHKTSLYENISPEVLKHYLRLNILGVAYDDPPAEADLAMERMFAKLDEREQEIKDAAEAKEQEAERQKAAKEEKEARVRERREREREAIAAMHAEVEAREAKRREEEAERQKNIPKPYVFKPQSEQIVRQLRSFSQLAGEKPRRAASLLHVIESVASTIDVRDPVMQRLGDACFAPERIGLLCMAYEIFNNLSPKLQLVHKGKRSEAFHLDSILKDTLALVQTSNQADIWLHDMMSRSEGAIVLSALMGHYTIAQPLVWSHLDVTTIIERNRELTLKGDRSARSLGHDELLKQLNKRSERREELVSALHMEAPELKKLPRTIPEPERREEAVAIPVWVTEMVGDAYRVSGERSQLTVATHDGGMKLIIRTGEDREDIQRDFRQFQQQVEQERAFDKMLSRLRVKCNFTIDEDEDGSLALRQDRLDITARLSGTVEMRLSQLAELYNVYNEKIHEWRHAESRLEDRESESEQYRPAALLERQHTALILDTNALIALDASRNGSGSWLELLAHTIALPNVTLILPSLVADFEYRGKNVTCNRDGKATQEIIKPQLHSATHGPVNSMEWRERFFKNARRMRTDKNGNLVAYGEGTNPNILIFETSLDREYYAQEKATRGLPYAERPQTFNLGEKSIEAMVRELPFEAHLVIVSDDMGYMSGMDYFSNPNSRMPVSRITLKNLLRAEFTVRPHGLQKLLGESRPMSLQTYAEDRMRTDTGWHGHFPDLYVRGIDAIGNELAPPLSDILRLGMVMQAERRNGHGEDGLEWSKLGADPFAPLLQPNGSAPDSLSFLSR